MDKLPMVYAREGSTEFNAFIEKTLGALAEEVRQAMISTFVALVLGGGYGRGDGACVLREGNESLYNDFDLFLVVTKPMEVPLQVLEVTKKYEHMLNIEVDIGKPLTINDIKHLPRQLMYQDLLQAHVVLLGDQKVLTANAPSYLLEPLPQVDALRLLLNRGSGLLQAMLEARALVLDPSHQMPDPDFIRRNREKCTLSFGDSLLIQAESYTPSLLERQKRVKSLKKEKNLENLDELKSLYEEAVTFKLRPDSLPLCQNELDDLLYIADYWVSVLLFVESKRTGKSWASVSTYANDDFIRESEQHTKKKLLRNVVKNLKRGKFSLRYPREQLYRQLASLLGNVQVSDPDWNREAKDFLSLWQLYN
ncbi:hypothetical protein [uncultured Sphaerochaeta sp.]|uniref:hypothetical protein n=1 Tax=uncultured Sphaerochaeta sp. TaxID=886478 RepID=UPI002A0A2172|nr:hypothetical protein [uncultured Sphaerochaeta sp.]